MPIVTDDPAVSLGRRLRIARILLTGALGAGLVVVAVLPRAAAQDEDQALVEGVQPVMQRSLSRGIERATQSIAAGEYAQALRFLDEVLGREDDCFVEGPVDGKFVGLKARAEAIIGNLPPEGRAAYEAAFGPVAQRELSDALACGGREQLRRIVQRYFHTPAGLEATLLLAQYELDAGRRLSSALLYDRLLAEPAARTRFDPQLSILAALAWRAAAEPQRAESILADAAQRTQVRIAGRPEPFPAGADAAGKLADLAGTALSRHRAAGGDWLTHRGNLQRNAETAGGLPHMRMRWQVRTLPHPELEETYEELAADLRRSGQLTPVAARPLALGDVLVARTLHTIYGIDFTTGKLLWQAEPGQASDLEQLLPRDAGADGDGQQDAAAAMAFRARTWQDYLSGIISSDGRRVFAVRGIAPPNVAEEDVWRGGPFGGAVETVGSSTNRLCAYDLAESGQRAWQIDGADVEGQLPGAYFLGAPLTVGETAYAMADLRDEVNLVALAVDTGELQWRQPLASLDYLIAIDQERRLQAAAPSYAAGMLVCPTGGGIVVGFDLGGRSLAWAYQYSRRGESPRYPRRMDEAAISEAAGRWVDAAATIAQGRVLLTPPESDELHCLDLRTGELLWKRDRGDMTAVACVAEGRILLVGNQKATALALADGAPVWKSDSLRWPEGALPTGSGFYADGRYYVPLSSGVVAAVDLQAGEIAARSTSRDGMLLGNLICHRGAILSQSGRFLERFDQVEALRSEATAALAADEYDVDALRTLGEIAMSENRRSEAIDLLEKAYRVAPDDVDVSDVLAECLTDALLEEFAAYRGKLPLLERLQDGTVDRRLALLRIRAVGLLEAGEIAEASEACFAIYRLIDARDEPLALGGDYVARPRRWLRAQVNAIYEAANAEQREAMLQRLRPLADAAVNDGGASKTARYLESFSGLPGTEAMQLARAQWLAEHGQLFAAQQQLMPLAAADDPLIRAEAVRHVIAGLLAAGQTATAEQFYHRHKALMSDFGDVGRAGAAAEPQSADGAPQGDLPSLQWPQGVVRAAERTTTAESTRYGARMPMIGAPLERTDDVLDLTSVAIAARSAELVVRDSRGRELFKTQLTADARTVYREPGVAYGVTHGSMLVVSLGHQVVALNTLAGDDDPAGAVLWQASVVGGFDRGSHDVESGGTSWSRPGSYRPPRATIDGHWSGVIGPASGSGVVIQDRRRLMCLDPLTGEVHWQRGDFPEGCDLYGDDELVFAVPRASRRAGVYSAIDGRALGERTVPSWREQLVTRGRVVIAWQRRSDGYEMSAVDAWTDEELWSHRFGRTARVDVDAGHLAAVVEPSGRAVVIDLETGEAVVDYDGPRQEAVDEVHLLPGSDSLTLVASRRASSGDERRLKPFNPHDYPTVNGAAYVFGRDSGQMRWNQPAEVRQQALMLTQGGDLPAIVFASGLPTRNGSGSRAQTTMLLLDKATGRTLYRSDELPAAAGGYCQPVVAGVSDDAPPQMDVQMSNRTVALTFTEEPRPPSPSAMAEVEAGSGQSRGGLSRLLQNVIDAAD